MPGVLYVVATPIGNLEDVTLRALRVFKEVALIAAEDTRRTARLLQHYSIPTPVTSLREHNERARTPGLIARLRAGDSIALVTDAGTPAVSDPGAFLVAAAHEAGVRVEPVPGPSAVMAALSASGITADQVLFVGFPPSRAAARRAWLESLRNEPRVLVLFEAPHRIQATLEEISAVFGNRRAALGRELTELHETLVVRPITDLLSFVDSPKGEYVLVITPASEDVRQQSGEVSDSQLAQEFGQLTAGGEALSTREALRVLRTRYGIPANELYQRLRRTPT